MIPRFFVASPLVAGREMALPAGAAHHAARVLRLKRGDALTLFDGQGGEYGAEIRSATARAVDVLVTERRAVERESPLEVTLAQALIASDHMDYAIQKAVELGARAIAPVATARGVARVEGERARRRVEHWRRIAIAACEQCGRNRVPAIDAPIDLDAWLRQASSASTRLILAPSAEASLADIPPEGRIELVVGPEGGWVPDEERAAAAAGFRSVRLGPRILRAETAGAAALAALNALWGDWR
jgi:16S rRNA (uracil1498-N3)-methyltransferase